MAGPSRPRVRVCYFNSFYRETSKRKSSVWESRRIYVAHATTSWSFESKRLLKRGKLLCVSGHSHARDYIIPRNYEKCKRTKESPLAVGGGLHPQERRITHEEIPPEGRTEPGDRELYTHTGEGPGRRRNEAAAPGQALLFHLLL